MRTDYQPAGSPRAGAGAPPEHCGDGVPDSQALLVECLAWGFLHAHRVAGPPVPVRDIVQHPLPVLECLQLLEVNLGLYDAFYRSCLDGARLIAVDLAKPLTAQRAGLARELYVAFCRSPRAAEVGWLREYTDACSDLFARCLLMPAAWVCQAAAQGMRPHDIAVYFGVPVDMVERRLREMGCWSDDGIVDA